MKHVRLFVAVGLAAAVAASRSARADEAGMRVATIPYDQCLRIIAETALDLDQPPVTLADTSGRRIVRIDAADGSVTIACRRSDNRMILTKMSASVGVGMDTPH